MEDIAKLGLAIESTQVRTAVSALDRLQSQARSVENQADKTTKSFDRMGDELSFLKTAIAGVGVGILVTQLSNLSDEAIQVSNSIKMVTTSSAELAAMQQKLLNLANDSRTGLAATASLYSKLTRSTEELGVSEERRLRVTELINKSFASSGATAIEAENAIRQLAQGLSAGVLRGDEFNSVAEQAPEILRAVSVETGKTTGELREFAAEGKITSELLIKSLENYGSTIDRIYARAGVVSKNYETIARNNAIAEVQSSELIMASKEAYGETLVWVSKHIDEFAQAGAAAATVYGVYLAQSAAKSMVASIAAAKATAAQTAVQNAAAAAALRLATAEKATASAALATARVQFAAAQGTSAHAFALTALNAAKTRSLTAFAAYNTAVAATTANVSRLSAVSSFLLGPWGLLITAVAAAGATFLIAKQNSADTADQMNQDADKISKLADSYSRLSKGALASNYIKHHEKVSEVALKRYKLEQQLADVNERNIVNQGRLYGQVSQLSHQIAALKVEEEQLKVQTEAYLKVMKDGEPALSSYTDGNKRSATVSAQTSEEYLKLRDSLALQITELSLSAEAYERFSASVSLGKDATKAERENIDQMILRLQALRKEKEQQDKRKITTTKFEEVQVELRTANNPAAKFKEDLDARLKLADEYRALDVNNEAAALQMKKDAYRVFYEEIDALQNKDADGMFVRLSESLASFKDQASGTMAAVALGFQDGDDAARQLATTILTQLVGAMINYGIEQAIAYATGATAAASAEAVKTAAVVASVSTQATAATAAQGVVTAGAVTSGAAIATAMAPAAAASSIASFGAAPAAAAPIALGTIAAIIAALVGGMALFGRAQGGQVLAGQTYKFNEKGPELFTPRSAGTVTPFNQLMAEARNGEGGGGDNVYLTIKTEAQVIDATDFQSVIAKNADAVANAVEKSLLKRGKRIVTR